jgi:hypothetical protein
VDGDPIDTSDNVGFVSGCFVFSVCFRLWPDLDVWSPSYSPHTILSLIAGTDEKKYVTIKTYRKIS